MQALIKHGLQQRDDLAKRADFLERGVSTAVPMLASLLADDVNEEVREIYDTQRVLERESRLLKQELAVFTAQTGAWAAKASSLVEALKHVGHFENYTAVLSSEAAALSSVLGGTSGIAAAPPEAEAAQNQAGSAAAAGPASLPVSSRAAE